jgi:hypothetical protein
MKKGLVLVIFSLMIVSVGLALAIMCPIDGVDSPTGCVCFHSPNSSKGFGQIIIGGATFTIISCNNTADGICPEDFKDLSTGIVGNCSQCADPDCTVGSDPSSPSNPTGLNITGYIWGYIKDSLGRPIYDATVTGQPIPSDDGANLSRTSPPTNNLGMYNFSGFITGQYQFIASKSSYNVDAKLVSVERGSIRRVDFTLENGSCSADCTDSMGRCNAACDGMTFNGSDVSCKFYDATVKALCNNKFKGTQVRVSRINDTASYYVDCCEGTPYKIYDATITSSGLTDVGSGKIKNLIKTEKIATHNDVPVRVIVAYWQ